MGMLEAMLSLMLLAGLLLVMVDQLGAAYRQQQQLQHYDQAHWAVADLLARLEHSNAPSTYTGACPTDVASSDWAQWCTQTRLQLGPAFKAQAHWQSDRWQLEVWWAFDHPPLTAMWVRP